MIHRRLLTALVGPGLVHAASQWCQELGADLGLAHADRYRLELCVEELATNLVKYGGDACAGRRVDWSVEVGQAELRLELVDPCVPFDPLAYEVAPLAPTLAELQVGGRGIQLLREFSDAGAYEFRDGCNRLALTFALEQPARAPGRPDGLADVAIFDGVPAAMVDDALRPVTVLDVADDVVLLERGEANDAVLLVLRGSLRVHLDDPGGEDFLEIGAGECVGEMSVIDDRPVSAYVRALPGARLLVVGAHAFLERVLTVPGVARNVMSAQAERMRRSDALNVARMRQLMEMEQARREMGFARTIQASMLPAEPLLDDDARLDCVGRMRPAREVGGDFYDLFLLDRRHLLFIVADVCGKSLPAALFMVRAIAALRAQPRQETPSDQHLEELVASLNEQLCDHNAARQFMTAFFGVLDLETYRLRYVNAGHNPPLLAAGDAPFTYWGEPVNPPVGMVRGLSYRSGEVELGPRGRVLLYTDGVTEAEDPGGRMLGEDRLLDRCRSLTAEGSQALVDAVFSEVDEFADGARQSDDITVLAIGPGAGSPASP
jgi:sigma-B regulation protein RsbU (phosphoserine phosphatase)